MRKVFIVLSFFALLFSSCQFLQGELDLDNIKDPEKDIFRIYGAFELDSYTREYTDYDDYMDIVISGYEYDGAYWDEYYFINNGDDTYTFYTYDEYWGYEDGYYDEEYYYGDEYGSVEEYFEYDEGYNDLADITYGDLDGDGYEDAVAIVFFNGEDYQSIDAHIFLNNGDDTYYNYSLSEVHYPSIYDDYSDYKQVVINDEYFTIELEGDNPKWERYITFKYDDYMGEFILHKDGGVLYDSEGNLVKEEVLDEDDFGEVYFYDFYSDESNYFNLKQEVVVSTVKELFNALSSNKRIYLEAGTYVLNDPYQLPQEARSSFENATGWDLFYEDDFYYLYGGSHSNDIQVTLQNLRNVDLIGLGDVDIIVTDEFLTVLTFENCSNMYVENIYLVHEVGGVCSADVVDLYSCSDMNFTDVTFDGSGVLGVYADASYDCMFTNCNFTNCSDGAIDFYDSYGDFYDCRFSDNTIWNALIYVSEYSSVYINSCLIEDNSRYPNDYGGGEEDNVYLFAAYNDASIYVNFETIIRNNDVDRTLNDNDFITID